MQQGRNRRRAFTARSVVASLLLGTRPPRLPGAALVRAASVLGCAEGTTRVALSRMAAAGELTTQDGWYELAGPLMERQRRQEAGRHPDVRPWDGAWVMAVAGADGPRSAGDRAELRRTLLGLRLAEWREGVWIRPDNLIGRRPDVPGCTWVIGARLDEPVRLWDCAGWAATAARLLSAMGDAGTALGEDLGASFALAAEVVRHLRDDPLLPEELLPRPWPGAALRTRYDEFETAFRAALRPVLSG